MECNALMWGWCCRALLPPSQQENLIVGLDLLRLLVQNRIAEFHTELELLSSQVSSNGFCSHVAIQLLISENFPSDNKQMFCTIDNLVVEEGLGKCVHVCGAGAAKPGHLACGTAGAVADGGRLQQGAGCTAKIA